MSLNVNYNSLYKKGIDTSVLKDVSKEILRRAAQKNSQYTNSLPTQHVNSLAKPVELGLDLYQGKIESNVQKQIAMNNSLQFNFNQQTLNSIQYLNTQAAYDKKVEGKYMPIVNDVTETQKASSTNSASHFVSIFTSAADKDKKGSNPFYQGELLMGGKKKETSHQADKLKSIFA